MPEKIYPVTVPKWGIEMQEGTITEWHLEPGSPVEKGQELVDIETDKIVNTMESPASGTLRRQIVSSGETLKVGELLGVIAAAEADDALIDAFIESFVPADASFGVGDELDSGDQSVEKPAKESSKVGQADQASSGSGGQPGRASPVARRLAEKLGVDLSQVTGTGRNGRISTEDVETAAAKMKSPDKTDSEPVAQTATAGQRLSGRALTQARRMVESKQTIPHFYLSRDLDMTRALAAQKASEAPLTAVIVHAMVNALQAEPAVNAHFRDNALFTPGTIGINIAVDTPEGLVAPVLQDLEDEPVSVIADRLKALAQRARNRELGASDLEAGGTTLSNLGMFGISSFSAIINPPQVAILAVGATRSLPIGENNSLCPAMSATLSCDHRAIDGAAGARFLAALQDALNQS